MSATQSYRCARCDTNWPYTHLYETCPRCRIRTYPDDSNPDMSIWQANKLLAAYNDFEKHYAALTIFVVHDPDVPPFEVRAASPDSAARAAAFVLGRPTAGDIIPLPVL